MGRLRIFLERPLKRMLSLARHIGRSLWAYGRNNHHLPHGRHGHILAYPTGMAAYCSSFGDVTMGFLATISSPRACRWNPLTVGYGSHAFIFGPQFGMFHGASEWRETFSRLRASISRSDACLGRTTALLFRSPAFNFDPVNSQEQQAQFGSLMRPLVEEAVKTPPSRRQP
mmetsp:Transcript_24573/g.74910  ORF Transcript_24573/g.74910 Transcript_24573/m.74910 type:complete len:171 (+) Transcript_24573:2004-2516(+)